MHRLRIAAWARNREALARAIDVVFPVSPMPMTVRARDIESEPLEPGALARASPIPLELWVVRQRVPIIYFCFNLLIVSFGDERFLAIPPEDDDSLPAYRCPPLDGSCPLPALQEREERATRLATLQAGGLFEAVSLGPRFHTLLRRRQAGPPLGTTERREILSLLFAVRFWKLSNSGHLRLPSVYIDSGEIPASIKEDLARPVGPEGVVAYEEETRGEDWVEVRCFPGGLRAIEDATHSSYWAHGFVEETLNHDSQVGGSTVKLWHCTLTVSTEGWRIERTLLWSRCVDGSEMS